MPTKKSSSTKRRRRMLSDEGSTPFEFVGFRAVYANGRDIASKRTWRTLPLPAMLGRFNLVSAWWEDCPENHSKKKRKTCATCRPLLDMENVLYMLSKEMVMVGHDGTITVVARHRELVEFIPDRNNDEETSAVKSLGSVRIGPTRTRRDTEPWMTFELRLEKFEKENTTNKKLKEKAEVVDETPATPQSGKRGQFHHGQQSKLEQKESNELPEQKESLIGDGMIWHQKTNDGIISRRRREATIFKSGRKARRRLQESSDEDDTSGDDEEHHNPYLAQKVALDLNTTPESSPARRALKFDKLEDSVKPPRKRAKISDGNFSRHPQDACPTRGHGPKSMEITHPKGGGYGTSKTPAQVVNSTPSGHHTKSKRFVTPEEPNTKQSTTANASAVLSSSSMTTERSNKTDNSTNGGQSSGPFSQQCETMGQKMGMLSMPGLFMSDDESSDQTEIMGSATGVRSPVRKKSSSDPGRNLAGWKLLAAKSPAGTCLHSLASLVLMKNESSTDGASLWYPSIVAPILPDK